MVDLHPNVLTYYDKHQDQNFIYLAIEKCEGNLENLIEIMKAIKLNPKDTHWHTFSLGNLYKKDPMQLLQPDYIKSLISMSLEGLRFLH